MIIFCSRTRQSAAKVRFKHDHMDVMNTMDKLACEQVL
jgi:hypothetical protein